MRDEADHALLERARAGDARAIEALLEKHQARVFRFGLKMCRSPEDAEDVLQDTLLSMARGVRDFRGASSISTWLFTIARSFCIKKRRRSKFAPEQERSHDAELGSEGNPLVDPGQSPDQALDRKRLEQALEQAIGRLEPIYREVLLLRDVEGLTAAEVAEVLGVRVQAVKSRLHRARLSVRASLAPLFETPKQSVPASGSCPEVLTLFSQHLEGEISAETCAEMERHLENCGACRGACESFKQTLRLCRTTGPSVPVPASVQKTVQFALQTLLTEKP